jgi:fimbrial chaperone protein
MRRHPILALHVVVLTLLVAGFAAPALAFKLEPISRVLAPSGAGASQSFELVNDGSERIAVEVSVWTLGRDEDYGEKNFPADDDFLVNPSQVLLAPGARQTVRVSWIGNPTPARELSFRLVAEQLPIPDRSKAAAQGGAPVGGLKIMMTFRGSLFVRPPGAAPRLALHAVALAKDPKGAPALAVTVANRGGAFGVVKDCAIQVTGSDRRAVKLGAVELKGLAKARILASSRRRFLLPWPTGLAAGPLKATGTCTSEP